MSLKVIITGSTGMVGKGVLYECLDSTKIESVLVVNRRPLGIVHPKLKEIIHHNFHDLTPIADQLKGYDTCFFCLGVSSFRMSEAEFTKLTYDLTVHFAETVLRMNPSLLFTYVSGTGTDSTGKGRVMWARVKGRTENTLLSMPFRDAYMFRPGYIQPMKGIRSSTALYNALYVIFKPLYPLMKALTPNSITSTVQVGRAMIRVAEDGYPEKILHAREINDAAAMESADDRKNG